MGASVGITVGVDGESEYSRSLKNITAETKAFQSELKTLQSSFGKNTSTWEKSSMTAGILTDEIDAQYRKLDALRTAQSQFAEGSTKWFEYADKINKATDAINKMEQQLDELPNRIQSIGEDFKTWGQNIQDSGKQIADFGDKMTRKITTPIIGGLTGVVKETADFDTAMAEVRAIAVSTQESLGRITPEEGDQVFDSLREKARQMGRETVYSATESANAMAYLARAGWQADSIIEGLDGVMALAAADGLDLASTASIVADGVTAFGKTADYASHFADILAMTSAQSNTNVEMLGESFKYVAPTAAALGYEVEDVALALGLSANNGVKASQAGTGLRQALKNLISPTDKVAEAADKFGISLYDAQGNALPLSDVIAQLRETFGDLNVEILDGNGDLKEAETIMSEYGDSLPITQQEKLQAIVDIFGTRAMPTMLSVISAGSEDFGDLEQAIYNCNNAAQTMSETRLDNIGGDFTLLKDEVLDLAISLGDIMVPVLRNDIIPTIREAVGWFNGLDDSTKELIIKSALFAAAVGPVLSVGGRLISGVGTLVGGIGNIISVVGGLGGIASSIAGGIGTIVSAGAGLIGSIGGVIGAIGSAIAAAAPVLIIIAAVVAAVAGLAYVIYKNWDDIKEWTSNLVTNVKNGWDDLKENTKNAWENMKRNVSEAWENMKRETKEKLEFIGTKIRTTWDDVTTKTRNAWNEVKTAVGNAAKDMIDNISGAARNIWDTISGTFSSIVDNAWNWGSNAINSLGDGLNSAWGWVESSVGGMGNFISNTLGNLASNAWNWGRDMVSNIADGMSSKINLVKNGAKSVADKIAGYLHFSLPDEGPLAHLDTFMPDMMKELAGGIYDNLGIIEKASDVLAGAIMPNTEGVIATNNTNSTTINNGGATINVYGAEGQNVNELADIVMRKLTIQVNRQAAIYG